MSIKAPSWKIPIKNYRQVLFWPLVFKRELSKNGGVDKPTSQVMAEFAVSIKNDKDNGWDYQADLSQHVEDIKKDGTLAKAQDLSEQNYAEMVFFHDFVQQSLFSKNDAQKGPCNSKPIHLLRNKTFTKMKCTVGSILGPNHGYSNNYEDDFDCELNFNVDRLNLYIFSTGVGVLALEVGLNKKNTKDKNNEDRAVTLADMQAFGDYFRRWHVPFWAGTEPGLLPKKVEWEKQGARGLVWLIYRAEGFEKHKKAMQAAQNRAPCPVDHWKTLLPEQMCLESGLAQNNAGRQPDRWRSISDDRLATSTFISLANKSDFEAILEPDWHRICYMDGPGSGWSFKTMDHAQFEQEHCFDWFWHQKSRQLFAGISYAYVGAGDFFDETLVHHFRRHYFQMGLLAQFEKASLLSFSGQITRAVEARDNDETGRDEKFEKRVLSIREEFLQFVHRFRFTGISNQMQPTKMYAMWRKHLFLDDLFKDVETELSASTDYIFAYDQREQTRAAAQLGAIATFAVVYGLALTVFGLIKCLSIPIVGFGLTIASFLGLIIMRYFVEGKNYDTTHRKLETVFWVIGLSALAVGVGSMCMGLWIQACLAINK